MAGKVICPNCGMENTSDAKFCRKCGTSLVAPRRPLTQNNTTNITNPIIVDDKTIIILFVFIIPITSIKTDIKNIINKFVVKLIYLS